MNSKSKNNIYSNGGYWYVRYKDPTCNKWKAISTRLPATSRNLKNAQEFRDHLIKEIKEFAEYDFRSGDIKYSFNHFLTINANKSPKTITTYKLMYSYLIKRIPDDTLCRTLDKKKSEDFLLWLAKLTHIGQNTKYGIQKNFLKYLRFLFEYEYNPKIFIINKDVRARAKVMEPLIFSDQDRELIIGGLSKTRERKVPLSPHQKSEPDKKPTDFINIKNSNFRTFIMMLLYSGLRPSDIKDVTGEQINLEKMEIKFYSPKTDRWFIRPLHSSLHEILKKRIDEVSNGRLFEYSDIKNMGRAFNRYLKSLGLEGKGYNLRTFRKDFISRCQEAGLSISSTATLVGHSNIKTTMTYYTNLSQNHLKSELEKLI